MVSPKGPVWIVVGIVIFHNPVSFERTAVYVATVLEHATSVREHVVAVTTRVEALGHCWEVEAVLCASALLEKRQTTTQ